MPKINYPQRIVPKDGRHLVSLKDVSVVENKFYDPDKQSDKYKTQFQWTWGYVDIPNMEIRSFSTLAPSRYKGKKNKMLEMMEALVGKVLSETEMTKIGDTDELIGKKCYVTVKHDKDENGTHAKIILFEPEGEPEPEDL